MLIGEALRILKNIVNGYKERFTKEELKTILDTIIEFEKLYMLQQLTEEEKELYDVYKNALLQEVHKIEIELINEVKEYKDVWKCLKTILS